MKILVDCLIYSAWLIVEAEAKIFTYITRIQLYNHRYFTLFNHLPEVSHSVDQR